MITIDYGQVYSTINGPDKEQTHAIRMLCAQELTFEIPGFYFMPAYQNGLMDGRKSFVTDGGKFLSGLLSRVLKVLHTAAIETEVVGYPEEHPKIAGLAFGPMRLLNGNEPDIYLRDYQMHAIWKAMRYSRGIWKLATNAGKTEVTAGMIKALNYVPSIVIVPRKELLHQTAERITLRLQKPVGKIGDSIYEPIYDGINVAMFQSLDKRMKDYKLITQRFLQSNKAVFGDECQFASDDRYSKMIKASSGDVRIGMSGTPTDKGDIEKHNVIGLFGPVLATVGNKQLVEEGVSVPAKIVFLEPKVNLMRKKMMEQQFWSDVLHNCEERNQLIGNIATACISKGMQTIIMVNKTEHGRVLQRYAPGAVLTHSQDPNRKKVFKRLQEGEVFCCIATDIFSTGISVDHLEAVIMAGGGMSTVALLQRLGRLLRKSDLKEKDTWCFDFWDTFNRVCRGHSRERWEIFKNEGAFEMIEDVNKLPIEILTEVLEGAGVNEGNVAKSKKSKWTK